MISALFPDYTPAQLSRIFEFYQEGLIKHNLGAIKRMWGIQPYRDFMAVVDSLKTMPYYIDLYSGALGVLTSNERPRSLCCRKRHWQTPAPTPIFRSVTIWGIPQDARR